jgi:hypothetical protein
MTKRTRIGGGVVVALISAMISALIVSSCAGSPPAQSGQDRLNRARSANAAAREGASSPKPVMSRDNTGKPSWVDRPDSVYDPDYYFAAAGIGSNRRQAEANALGNLTGRFGRSVENSIAAVEKYKEQVDRGAVDISSNIDAEQAVRVSSSMESLIGAEINDVWDDGKGSHYAVAIMDKAKTIPVYRGLIEANLRLIDRLTNVPAARRTTLEGVAASHTAAGIAGANAVFASVLFLLGGPDLRAGMKSAGDYNLEANDIARQIPVNTAVEGDVDDRIRIAFGEALGSAGLIAGGSGSRYGIKAKLSLSPVTLDGQANKFSRFLVTADFTDGDLVLFSFSVNGREGHVSQSQADERAVREAAARVRAEYGGALEDYLTGRRAQR